MLPVNIVRVLIYVMSSILPTEPYNTLLAEITDNSGNLNYEALTCVETVLAQNGRMDIVELIQRTMAGDYSLLKDFQNYLQHSSRFQESDHHPGSQFRQIYYRYTTNNNPVRQESGNTQSDEQPHEPLMPTLFEQLGNSPPKEPGQANEASGKKVPLSAQPGRENVLASHGNHVRIDGPISNVEPRSQVGVRCRNCENDLNVIKTSSRIWGRIDDIMEKLSPQQVHHFMEEVKKYDHRILSYAQFQNPIPLDIVPNILRALRRYNLQDEKCVLCLLVYVFQRIGRSDLADEVKELRQMRRR